MNTASILSRLQGVKKSGNRWTAKCPAHDDGTASLSISTGDDGRTLLHCHAVCTPDAICSALGLKLSDLFSDNGHAKGNGSPAKSKPAFYWQNCIADFGEADAQKLAAWRGLSVEFVRWLHAQGVVGIFEGKIAFANHGDDGRVISAHVRLANGKWIFKPTGYNTAPLVFGDTKAAGCVLTFESQWDAFAVMDKLDWHTSSDVLSTAVFITRGAGNGKLIRGHVNSAALVYAFKQNDQPTAQKPIPAGDVWLGDVAGNAACKVLNVETPLLHADANDWTRAGATASDLKAAMKSAKQVQPKSVQDPLPGNKNVLSATHADTGSNHFKSDVGYGDAIVERYANTIRHCADEKLWLVFDDENGWRRDNTGLIKAMAADYARELYRLATQKAVDMEPDEGRRLIASMAVLGNKKRIEPALSFAACNPAIVVRSEQLDADPFLVGVENGVVDLRDGSFQTHKREHLVTRRLAVKFQADATAPTWDTFLAEVQPDVEMRNFLQRLSGYSLTGEMRDHVLPFHFGTGANGKGTFLEHALLKLAGSYGAKLTDSLIYASDRGHLPHLELANLCGKRFALGEENTDGGKLNEALLKSITGGDRQKGRFHYGNFVEYFPTYKIALVGNHKPRITGTDDGIWRRFLLVDWPVQIPKEKRDGTLKDKLAAEMPGILNWCIAGARAWLSDGLNPPQSCTAATEAFRDKSDVLNEFIAECFEADSEMYCTKADAFAAYQRWAAQQGIQHPMSKRALGFQLINRGWQEFKQGHENSHCWSGFRLKNQFEE